MNLLANNKAISFIFVTGVSFAGINGLDLLRHTGWAFFGILIAVVVLGLIGGIAYAAISDYFMGRKKESEKQSRWNGRTRLSKQPYHVR